MAMAQVIVSGLGLTFSLIAAGLLFLLGLVGLFSEAVGFENVVPLFALAWFSLLLAVLAAPSLLLSFRHLSGFGPQLPKIQGLRLANLSLMLWPLVLVLGHLLARQETVSWLVMPPLNILAIGLPVWWLVEFARRNLQVSSRKRGWGVFNFSMFLSTPAVMVVELVVMGTLFLVAVAWIMTQPELMYQLERLGRRIIVQQPDLDMILEYLRPYLQNPLVIFAILAMVAGLVPLIEELLKPLALWALAGREISPGQGFAAGAIAGGGFALLESLLSLSNPAMGAWAALAAGRAGTALLHITTTAIVGWAMALSWQKGDFLRLGAAYLLAVGLHAAWNMLSVFSGLGAFYGNTPQPFSWLAQAAPFGLAALALGMFLMLWFANRMLQRSEGPVQQAAAPDGPAASSSTDLPQP
jgi:hypothetical protein